MLDYSDLMAAESEAEAVVEQVNRLILKNNSFLKQIYKYYQA